MSAPRATDDVLVHRGFGDATLARMRRQHEQQLAAQVGAANHLVFQERAPGGLHPTAVFEEFEHLEALYFGGGANQQRARLSVGLRVQTCGDAQQQLQQGGDGFDAWRDGEISAENADGSFDVIYGPGDYEGGVPPERIRAAVQPLEAGTVAGAAEIDYDGAEFAASSAARGAEELTEEQRRVQKQVEFVSMRYLSQKKTFRTRRAADYADFDDGVSTSSAARDAAYGFRVRLQARLARAGVSAQEFAERLEGLGVAEGRAVELAALTQNVSRNVKYARNEDTGVFEKYEGDGTEPPSAAEIVLISKALDREGGAYGGGGGGGGAYGGGGGDGGGRQQQQQTGVLSWYQTERIMEEPEPEPEPKAPGHRGRADADSMTLVPPGSSAGEPSDSHRHTALVPKAAKKYISKKPPPRAATPPPTDGTRMVCAFCGRRAPPVLDVHTSWRLQQYFDDRSDRLVRHFFCPQHNFQRLLLRRPTLGVQVKSHVWKDLRETAILDRQHRINRRWCARCWLCVCGVGNVLVLLLALFLGALSVMEGRCAELPATATHTFSFERAELRGLRLLSTRGTIRVVAGGGPAGSTAAHLTVDVGAASPEALALVEVGRSFSNTTGVAEVVARVEGAGRNGGERQITVRECYSVHMQLTLPAAPWPSNATVERHQSELDLTLDQRWKVSECTVAAADWPFSMLPARLLPLCIVGRRVAADDAVSISLGSGAEPPLILGAVSASTNGGAVVASGIHASARIDVRAARGFEGRGLRASRLTVRSLGGDIVLHSLDSPLAPLGSAGAIAAAGYVWLARGVGARDAPARGVRGGAQLRPDRGRIVANLTGLPRERRTDVRVTAGDADVEVRLREHTRSWSATLSSCGGAVSARQARLEPAPVLPELPLICQQFFDAVEYRLTTTCPAFAAEARAAGQEWVTADLAGNGFCDQALNVEPCYDGGDCCGTSCVIGAYPERCGLTLNDTANRQSTAAQHSVGDSDAAYNCTDPWVAENFGPMPDCGAITIARNQLHADKMAVYNRGLSTMSKVLGWSGAGEAAYGERAGIYGATMLPTRTIDPGTGIERSIIGVDGAGKAWGWHTCTFDAGRVFDPVHGLPPTNQSRLTVELGKGDVQLTLEEHVPFSRAWEYHVRNTTRGWGCTVWGCVDADECLSLPCLNGGTCSESGDHNFTLETNVSTYTGVAVGWYNCSCPAAFGGNECEISREYQSFRFVFSRSQSSEKYVCVAELWFWDALTGQRLKANRLGGVFFQWATARAHGQVRYAGSSEALNYATSQLFDDDTTTSWCSPNNGLAAVLDVTFDEPIRLSRYALQASRTIVHPSAGHVGARCIATLEPCLSPTEIGGFGVVQDQCRADAISCQATAAGLSGLLADEARDIADCEANAACVYEKATYPQTAAPTEWAVYGMSQLTVEWVKLDVQTGIGPWGSQQARTFTPYDPVDNPFQLP